MEYKRIIGNIIIKAIQFSDNEFHIFVGSKLYAILDNIADAYREYNSINSDTIRYLGLG